ncbi:MAG TPA: hypothetical protein VGH27_07585 [Streptosporangiaceae bacterium]|jgi:hypothetical protein
MTVRINRTIAVLGAAALCVLGAATAANASPPGLNGSKLTLVKVSQQVQFTGGSFDAAADTAGDTYISWIANTTPGGSAKAIYLCTLKPQGDTCSGGIQKYQSTIVDTASDLELLPGSTSVTLVWYVNSPTKGTIYKSVAQAGGKPGAATAIATVPANGEMFDAVMGPSGHIWTVSGDDVGDNLTISAEGSSPPSPAQPFAAGYARLAFSGNTAVLAIQQGGSITVPISYASLTGSKWSAFQSLAGTWSGGYGPGLTTTASGLRIVTASPSYVPVAASWNGTAFGPIAPIGNPGTCAPSSAETRTDASGRLADVTNECGKITVDNLQNTTKAATVRFDAGGTVAGSIPEIATLPSGRAWVVYAIQTPQSDYHELLAAPVLLPTRSKNITTTGTAGSVTVNGPVSCLPVIDTSVGVSAAWASGWHVTSTSLTLDGAAQSGTLAGASLKPGKSYTLAGTAKFADGSKTQSATANLTFKACPAP